MPYMASFENYKKIMWAVVIILVGLYFLLRDDNKKDTVLSSTLRDIEISKNTYWVKNIIDTTMSKTNQRVVVFYLTHSRWDNNREERPLVVSFDSEIAQSLISEANSKGYIRISISNFIIQDEIRNGIAVRVYYHSNVRLERKYYLRDMGKID